MIRLVAALTLFAAAAAAEPDYRKDNYRAPVPDSVPGGTVIDVYAAYALWQAGEAVFVDVLPRPPKPANLPEGTLWQEHPRASIPGAIWLPNVGYGDLAPIHDAYFRGGLHRATEGDPDRTIVIFCLADCWMSWNAAMRAALEYGYSDIRWFPGGTDDWTAAGFRTEAIETVRPQPP